MKPKNWGVRKVDTDQIFLKNLKLRVYFNTIVFKFIFSL